MITNNFETGKNKQSVYATVCNLFEIDWGYGYLIIKFRHLMTHLLLNFFYVNNKHLSPRAYLADSWIISNTRKWGTRKIDSVSFVFLSKISIDKDAIIFVISWKFSGESINFTVTSREMWWFHADFNSLFLNHPHTRPMPQGTPTQWAPSLLQALDARPSSVFTRLGGVGMGRDESPSAAQLPAQLLT